MSTYDFTWTRNELIESAFKKIRVVDKDGSLTANQLSEGIETLNSIIREFDVNIVYKHLWAIKKASLTLQANTFVYTTSNGLASDILDLVDVVYRDASAYDTPCDIIDSQSYQAIHDKLETGDVKRVYLTREMTLSSRSLYIHPAPNTVSSQSEVIGTDSNNYRCIKSHTADSTNRPITGANWKLFWELGGSNGSTWVDGTSYTSPEQLIYEYKRPLYDFDTATDNPDIPQGWHRFLLYAVAADLADNYGLPLDERVELDMKASKLLENALGISQPKETDYHNKGVYY